MDYGVECPIRRRRRHPFVTYANNGCGETIHALHACIMNVHIIWLLHNDKSKENHQTCTETKINGILPHTKIGNAMIHPRKTSAQCNRPQDYSLR